MRRTRTVRRKGLMSRTRGSRYGVKQRRARGVRGYDLEMKPFGEGCRFGVGVSLGVLAQRALFRLSFVKRLVPICDQRAWTRQSKLPARATVRATRMSRREWGSPWMVSIRGSLSDAFVSAAESASVGIKICNPSGRRRTHTTSLRTNSVPSRRRSA